MSANSAIPCCCTQPSFICCKTYTTSITCLKEITVGCDVFPDGYATIESTRKVVSCVFSEEDCVCEDGEIPPNNPPNTIVVKCEAEFIGERCENNQVPDDFQGCKSENPPPCCISDCGPCGPKGAGASAGPCPPTPYCEEQPCCNPPPPPICCCVSFTENENCAIRECIGPCPIVIPDNCYTVSSCSDCENNIYGIWVWTACCASYPCTVCGADDDHACGDPVCLDPASICCDDCVSGDCVMGKCIGPCPNPVAQLPLCPCMGPFIGGLCVPAFPATKYGDLIENSIEKGLIKTKTGVNLNTLFLFGYGYNNL
jgi:hypothetical protein